VEQQLVRKRALWKALPVAFMGRLLELRGKVRRAPNFALIEVTDATSEAFIESVSSLTNDFDRTVVLWHATTPEPMLAKKFKVVPFSEQFQTRWSLLQHCANGFVFPIRAGTSKPSWQQRELKAQLFVHGGNCIVGFANLKQFLDPSAPLAGDFKGPVLVSSLDVDEIVFDQRFLKIRPSELASETETQDLANLARKRQAAVLAIDVGESEVLGMQRRSFAAPQGVTEDFSRSHLIENVVRMPTLAKLINVRTARLWNSIWRGLGYSPTGEVTSDQVQALAAGRGKSMPSRAEADRARTILEILGGAK